MTSKNECDTKSYILYNNNGTFVSLIYTVSLAGNIIVYTPIRGTKWEKYFIHFTYEGKNADSGAK